jgi:hypothetical protein
LGIYGLNDAFFEPTLVKRLHAAYLEKGRQGAPLARLVAYGAFGQDAHGMVEYSGGVKIWWPELERELQRLGLPR